MKIDIHNHILPESWPDLTKQYGYPGWIHMVHNENGTATMMKGDQFFRTVEKNCWCPETRLKEMEKNGVTVQVLSTVPVMFSYWAKALDALDLSKFLNDHLADVVKKYPKHFVALGTVPLQDPSLAIQEMTRCIKQLNFPGVQIGSHVNEWNLDAPELLPFFEAAEQLNCALFIHPWDMDQGGRMKKYFMPWLVGMPSETTLAICSLIFGGVLEKFPKLKICFAHGAGNFPYTIGRIEQGFYARPDLCAAVNKISPKNYSKCIYSDTLVHNPDSLRLLIKVIGEDHVILGTDYPFPLGELQAGQLVESMDDLDQKLKDKILCKNALEFLNLSYQQFI